MGAVGAQASELRRRQGAVYTLDVPVHSVLQVTAANVNGQGPEARLQLGSCNDDGLTGTDLWTQSGPLDVTVDPPLDPGTVYLHCKRPSYDAYRGVTA